MRTAIVTPLRPLAELEIELKNSWVGVTQATYQFLVLLREFDLRQGWAEWGSADCADWLNWQCGINRSTAQDKLRTARALHDLPQIEEAFKRGDLSYSKVRALCRVAAPMNETDLLDYALGATAAQVEGYCRRLRNGDREQSAVDARRQLERRSLYRSFREDGSGCICVELPREDVELVMQALDRVAGELPQVEGRSLFATAADALVQMARDALAGGAGAGSAADQFQVVVHVDESALRNEGGISDLPVESVRRLCCDGSLIPIVENGEGEPLSVGRKQRTIPVGIRRALAARDRGCCFPGCSHDRWVDAHHIQHWVDGGETSMENLMLLCTHHHRLLHEGGYNIHRRANGTCHFLRPDGRPVETPARRLADQCVNATALVSAESRARHT